MSACRHLVIRYARRPRPDGTFTEHWVCNNGDCRQEFIQRPAAAEAVNELTDEIVQRLGVAAQLATVRAELEGIETELRRGT